MNRLRNAGAPFALGVVLIAALLAGLGWFTSSSRVKSSARLSPRAAESAIATAPAGVRSGATAIPESAREDASAPVRDDARAPVPGGRVALRPPDSRDARSSNRAALQARAVAAEVVEGDELSELPAGVPATALAPSAVAEAADIELLGRAFAREQSAEEKADLLALASSSAEPGDARLRRLILEALRPSQPIEVRRQALYLAAQHHLGLARSLARNEGHPLQQDAEAFLLERELDDASPRPRERPRRQEPVFVPPPDGPPPPN